MNDMPETSPEESMDAWQQALSIHVGTVYGCRRCGNLVIVTRGGVGNMELSCCGEAMQVRNPRGCGGAPS